MIKIIVLAMKNVFRNRRRTFITGLAIFFGVFILINAICYIQGLYDGMVDTVIQKGTGHLQIHAKGYVQAIEDRASSGSFVISMRDIDKLIGESIPKEEIRNISKRMVISSLINKGDEGTSAYVMGIIPDHEKDFMKSLTLTAGSFLQANQRGKIMVNERIERVLDIHIGDEITITTQTYEEGTRFDQYEVIGVYNSGMQFGGFKGTPEIYINLQDAQLLAAIKDEVSEVVIELIDKDDVNDVIDNLNAYILQNSLYLEVHDWKYLGKSLLEIASYIKYGIRGWTGILFIVIIFAILNTFLMSVYERTYEIGILKAIGMKRSRILLLFLLESFFLSIFATGFGLMISFLTVNILSRIGLPSMFGFLLKGESVHPTFNWLESISIVILAIIASCIAGLYPAWRASRMNPIDALRSE